MVKTLGVDFGTSNSCGAYHDGHNVIIIESLDGSRLIPSVVGFRENGAIDVGRTALKNLHQNKDYTFKSSKRVIGTEFDEDLHGWFQYREGPNGEVWFQGPERLHSPAEIASFILRDMLDAAEQKLGFRPDGLCITHPASFNKRQRNSLVEAAMKAGIDVGNVHLYPEPDAAALAYGIGSTQQGKGFAPISVYDLGGGTFDVSIMHCGRDYNKVVGLDGKEDLGGDDFDKIIEEWVLNKWFEETGIDINVVDPGARLRILNACEQAKIDLTRNETTEVYVDMFHADAETGIHTIKYELTRADFVAMTRHLIDESIAIFDRVVKRAKLPNGVEGLKHLILVGGMTRMPAVREAVEKYTGLRGMTQHSPEEAVAIGAATKAAMLDKRIGGVSTRRVSPTSIGLESATGEMTVIVPKGTALPYGPKRVIATNVADDETTLVINVVEGQKAGAAYNSCLVMQAVDIDPVPVGEASVEVVIEIDENADPHIIIDGRACELEGAIENG